MQATALKQAYHNPALTIARFSRTGRPHSDLQYIAKPCAGGLYLPIVRYESLYYESTQEYIEDRAELGEIVPTFYFYEPDSHDYLDLGRTLVAASKFHALLLLGRTVIAMRYFFNALSSFLELPLNSFTHLLSIRETNVLNFLTELKKFLLGHPSLLTGVVSAKALQLVEQKRAQLSIEEREEVAALLVPFYHFHTTILQNEADLTKRWYSCFNYGLNRSYTSTDGREKKNIYLGAVLVGEFDEADADMASAAHQQNYTTIILQHEPGETRLVTEILDVRPRLDSYAAVCQLTTTFQHPQQTATIWFPSQGLLNNITL